MPANESSVLVRLRLLGGQIFAREATRDAESLAVLGKAATGAAARLRGVSAAMGVASGAFMGAFRLLRRAAIPLALIGGAATKAAVDFQRAMELIHTQAGASQSEVNSLSKSVIAFAKSGKAGQGPTDLANALYRLEGAGIRGKKAMDALKASSDLAAVGNANVEDTAKTLSQTWFSGIKGGSNFKKVVAELNATVGAGDLRLQQLVDALGVGILPVAKNAGLGLRDITGVLSVFGDETNNVSGWTAQLATALHYLYAPTAKAEKALGSIGLSGTKLGKDFRKKRGLLTAMTDLRSHLDKLPGGFRGLKAAQTLADILPGGRGRVLNVLLGQLDRYRAKLKQVGGTTNKWGDAVTKTHETAAFKIHAAWAQIQAVGVQLGGHLLPVVAPAIKGIGNLIVDLSDRAGALGRTKGFKAFTDKAKSAGKQFVGAVRGQKPPGGGAPARVDSMGVAPAQATTAQKIGTKVRAALGGLVAWASKNLPKIGKQLVDAFKPAMPFLTNVLLPLFKGVGEGIIAAFLAAIPAIKILATVLGFLGKLAAPIKPVFEGIGLVIGFLAAGPILRFLSVIPKIGIVFRLMAVPIDLANVGFKVFWGVLRVGFGIVARLVGFWLKAHLAILRFVATIGGAAPRVVRGALNVVGGVIHTLETLPGRVVALAKRVGTFLVSGIAGGVRSKLGSLISFFGRVGKVILDAVVNAIKAAPGAIVGAISSIVPDKLKGAVHKVLGAFASGGLVNTPLQVVGERGPELAALPRGSRVMSNAELRGAVRGGQSMAPSRPIMLTANLHLSGKQVHQEVFTVERAALERT